MGIKFLSLNVHGLNSPYKRSFLWKDLMRSKCDIACLQETHLATVDVPRLKHKRFPYIFHTTSPLKKAGVAILIKDSVTFKLNSSVLDPKGRFVLLQCEINSLPYTILSIYAPNKHQLRFIRRVITKAKQLLKGGLVICGDFNIVADKELDKSRGCARLTPELKKYLLEEDLHDLWRYQHPGERDFTFYSAPQKTHSRIDFFLLDRIALGKALSSGIGIITWSDHAPIELTLRDAPGPPGISPWRINNFLLKSPQIVAEISSQLTEFFKFNTATAPSPSVLWCAHKAYIRGVLLQIASREKKAKQTALNSLLDEIAATDNLFKSNPSTTLQEKLKSLRSKLRTAYLSQYEQRLSKLKWRFYLQGDRPGRLLANRVRAYQARSKVSYISGSDGSRIYDPQHIAESFANYYKDLYNLKDDVATPTALASDVSSFLDKIALPKLTVDQLEQLNAPIESLELLKVINSSKLNKSPGPDGLNNEYYKLFKNEVLPSLTSMFNFIVCTGQPPAEMLQAIITTIPKPGKSPDQVTNYRPISLLNCDY